MSSLSTEFSRKFFVDQAIFTLAPEYRRIVVLASGKAPSGTSEDLSSRFEVAVRRLPERFLEESVSSSPFIEPWREVFRAAGYSPAKFRSSIEALVRRGLRKELFPLNSPLVDIGTIATLEHLVPIGVHVLDELPPRLPLGLLPASGVEQFKLFDGAIESPAPGEIVYKCGDVVLTRRWTWRQGVVGSVTPSSRNVAVNIDLIAPTVADAAPIVSDLSDLLSQCGFETLETFELIAGRAQVEPHL